MAERKDYGVLISVHMHEEAEVMASALRAHGIDAFVGNRHHANVDWGQMLALGGLQVFVPREKIDEAKETIRECRRHAAETSEDEPVGRRDRFKMWLVMAGWFALGLFGIGTTASHTLDEVRISQAESYLNTMDPCSFFGGNASPGVVQVLDGGRWRAVPCDDTR